jgi:hypothetical protein
MDTWDQIDWAMKLAPDVFGDDGRWNVVPCDPPKCWKMVGTLENLTVTPSLDASKSGNWHGWIRNGRIE